MTKQQARAMAKERWRALPPEELRRLGQAMADRLFALPLWREAGTVFCFAAMKSEPDLTPVLRRALADGKRLAVPRVAENGRMEAVPLADLAALAPGAYGILEPPGPGLPPGALPTDALALVPCLAADRRGVRLGRGGGYYDRFLGQYKGRKLLLCPQALLFDALPFDGWDQRFAPGELLTEKGLLL